LNVRQGPSTSYAVVKVLNNGASVCVISFTSSNWAKIAENQYVSGSYLKKASSGSSNNTPAPASCTTKYTTSDLNVRTGPGTNYSKVKTLARGASVCVVSTTNGWAKLNDGYYVSNSYLTATKPATNSGNSNYDGSNGTGSLVNLNIVQRNSPNKSGRQGWTPDVIVCHITEGGYSGAVSWLCNPDSGVSCHFVVSRKGEVSQLVPIQESSWCQGISTSAIKNAKSSIVRSRNVNPNRYCVGIEHEGMYKDCQGCLTDAQKNASGSLIRHIRNEVKRLYGVTIPLDRDHVIGHYEINPTGKPNCPGQNFPFSDVIAIANK